MKRVLLALFLLAMGGEMFSNPGDTTWVTVFNLRKLTQYGNYDTTAVFPTGKKYRKVRLHYILGRYACPSGTQYCGSWDYTTQIYARHAGKDSVEIARVITPYATDWLGQNKTHDYIIDVTDYTSVLDGTTGMRFNYSGYSWGFTITLKIEFIEGTPGMEAMSVRNIYDGYYPYGNANNPIENYLTPKTRSYTNGGRAYIKNTVSGHGSDGTYCSEFCSKYYQLFINNSMLSQKQLWRSDCGLNQVYPQTGTWIYERANWCPGAVVWPIYHDVSNVTSVNQPFTVNVDMQPYTISNPSAGYNWVSQLIDYGTPAYSRDVAMEDIISPTTDDNYVRNNPNCMNPVVKVRNNGIDTVKSIVFSYGMQGSAPLTYTWTGALPFYQTSEITFPPSSTALSGSVSGVFQVSVTAVNGTNGDQDSYNNIYLSKTKPVLIFPPDFVIVTLTNNSLDASTMANETTWEMTDEQGNVIFSRNGMSNQSIYADTVNGIAPGCYKLEVKDSGCDGMYWWANSSAGAGSLRIDKYHKNNTLFNFPVDIGCGYTMYFTVPAPPIDYTGIQNQTAELPSVSIFPNPAGDFFHISFDNVMAKSFSYSIVDLTGRTIVNETTHPLQASFQKIMLPSMTDGVYMVKVRVDGATVTRRLVVHH